MLPYEKVKRSKNWSFKYLSLDHIAYQFACKENTVAIIFNHSSTEYLDQPIVSNEDSKDGVAD